LVTTCGDDTWLIDSPIESWVNGWVKLNAGQEVPMRVLNTPEMLKRLSEGIKSKTLHPVDRAGLLTDAYALVKAGHMSPEALIQLAAAYVDEDSYVVWQGLSEVLNGLDTIMSDDEKMSVNCRKSALLSGSISNRMLPGSVASTQIMLPLSKLLEIFIIANSIFLTLVRPEHFERDDHFLVQS